MQQVSVLLCIVLLGFPESAYAYLDPASGSAMLSFVLGVSATVVYFCKSIYAKVVLGEKAVYPAENKKVTFTEPLVVFSEGKSYWGTFKPIVEELIRQQVYFKYISLDLHDPALEIDSPFMSSTLMQPSQRTFYKLSRLQAGVMLATTPNIGSADYPLSRSLYVKNLVHIFHAMSDISNYRKGGLDYYDSVIMMGDHQKEAIRFVEDIRGIRKIELVALGLPYLDDLYSKRSSVAEHKIRRNDKPHILVAPSWGTKGCFSEFGTQFVKDLDNVGYNVIVRLHPHSYKFESENVATWKEELSACENVHWDEEMFGTTSMEVADILISDTSSVRFDFAFVYQKPVITCDIPAESRDDFESSYFKKPWAEKVSPELGVVVKHSEISNMCSIVQNLWNSFDPNVLLQLREDSVSNFGNSAPAIVSYLQEKVIQASWSPIELTLRKELVALEEQIVFLHNELESLRE